MRAIPWEVGDSKLSDAYIAGFLDGDGSIVATLELRPERRRFPNRVRLKINFTQHARHIQFLEMLKNYLGEIGSIYVNKKKNLAELVIQDRAQVRSLLVRFLPHLILKRRQAVAMLNALEVYAQATVNVRSSLTEKEYETILSFVRDIRSLNSGTGGKRA